MGRINRIPFPPALDLWELDTNFGSLGWSPAYECFAIAGTTLFAIRSSDGRLMRRTGPNTWVTDATRPANRYAGNSMRPYIMGDGTDLWGAFSATGPLYYSELYKRVGGSWSMIDRDPDWNYSEAASLFFLDGKLHWVSLIPTAHPWIHVRTQNPGWTTVSNVPVPRWNMTIQDTATTRVVVPRKTHWWNGGAYNTASNSNLPSNFRRQIAHFDSKHWVGDGAQFKTKAVTATAWGTASSGGWLPNACYGSGGNLFMAARKQVGAGWRGGIIKYDGTRFDQELNVVGLHPITEWGFWFAETSGGELWCLTGSGLYRRMIV